jgi:DNA-binding NarL/FixJ family response regulator
MPEWRAYAHTVEVIRVLIVDDHPAVRLGMAAIIRAEPGFRVVGMADDGVAALAQAGAKVPDCALVDYNLGPDDGVEVCRQLRELPNPPAVVVYSAFADEELALEAEAAGAHAVLNKSAEIAQVLDALRLASRQGSMSPRRIA